MNETKTNEDRLRAEIEELKRQLQEEKGRGSTGSPGEPKGPSVTTLAVLGLLFVALVVAGFFLGYLPRQRREMVLAAE